MHQENISICIPAFNEGEKFAGLLEYLFSFSPMANEIILCIKKYQEKDSTLETALKYSERDSRIKIIIQEGNGKTDAWNTLVTNASNENLVFFDADVIPQPNCIENLVEVMHSNDEYIAVGGIPIEKYFGKSRLSALAKSYIPGQNLNGRLYAIRKSRMLDKLPNGRIPSNVLYEDFFLQMNLNKKELGIARNANIVSDAGMLDGYLIYVGRDKAGLETLAKDYPDLFENYMREFKESGNWTAVYLKKLFGAETIERKALGITAFFTRKLLNLIYANRIHEYYRKTMELHEKRQSHNMLGMHSLRAESTK